MKFTMRGLTRSLAGCLAPHLPNAAFYDNPNQQGTRLPAMFLQRTRAKITMKMGGRFLRRLGLDLVYLVDYNQVDMDDQYTRAADILDERLETFPYSDGEGGQSAILRTHERSWSIQDDALHYKFDLNIWVSPEEDAVLMGSIQSYNEEVS